MATYSQKYGRFIDGLLSKKTKEKQEAKICLENQEIQDKANDVFQELINQIEYKKNDLSVHFIWLNLRLNDQPYIMPKKNLDNISENWINLMLRSNPFHSTSTIFHQIKNRIIYFYYDSRTTTIEQLKETDLYIKNHISKNKIYNEDGSIMLDVIYIDINPLIEDSYFNKLYSSDIETLTQIQSIYRNSKNIYFKVDLLKLFILSNSDTLYTIFSDVDNSISRYSEIFDDDVFLNTDVVGITTSIAYMYGWENRFFFTSTKIHDVPIRIIKNLLIPLGLEYYQKNKFIKVEPQQIFEYMRADFGYGKTYFCDDINKTYDLNEDNFWSLLVKNLQDLYNYYEKQYNEPIPKKNNLMIVMNKMLPSYRDYTYNSIYFRKIENNNGNSLHILPPSRIHMDTAPQNIDYSDAQTKVR